MLCQVHNDEAVNFFKNELKTSSKLVAVDYYMYSYLILFFLNRMDSIYLKSLNICMYII